MDSIWWTVLFVYLVGLAIEFVWLTKIDTSHGRASSFARDGINLIESALWPIALPLQALFFIIVTVFDLILATVLFLNEAIHELIRRHRG